MHDDKSLCIYCNSYAVNQHQEYCLLHADNVNYEDVLQELIAARKAASPTGVAEGHLPALIESLRGQLAEAKGEIEKLVAPLRELVAPVPDDGTLLECWSSGVNVAIDVLSSEVRVLEDGVRNALASLQGVPPTEGGPVDEAIRALSSALSAISRNRP